ncbi:MAG: DUF86 domain-containing protein [Gammaproteobacteria bacterium]|nr:DUF86 domain-containing protein [Gammaproteobacteria bacterium]
MQDNIIAKKIDTIERCLERIRDKYESAQFENDLDMQDVIILNLQRTCEAAIDIAGHVARLKQLEIPQATKEVFVSLEQKKLLSKSTSQVMQDMVGFRNIAIHEYQDLDLLIVKNILKNHLKDFQKFIQEILAV